MHEALLIVAVILFILDGILNVPVVVGRTSAPAGVFLAFGLAAFAGAFLVNA